MRQSSLLEANWLLMEGILQLEHPIPVFLNVLYIAHALLKIFSGDFYSSDAIQFMPEKNHNIYDPL